MQVIENKALLIQTKWPDRITSVIPKSKRVSWDGTRGKVLVHWCQDAVQVLHNLGYKKTPTIMEKEYNWPGMYTPFAHQKVTSGFLSVNRRAYVLSEQGCVDSDTEYLSPTGWVRIADYVGGDVAQYHPDTEQIEFVAPEAYVKKPCEEMIHFKTKYGIDQMLSPEHRMLLRNNRESASTKWKVMSAEEMWYRHEENMAGRSVPVIGSRKLGTDTMALSIAACPATYKTEWGEGIDIGLAELRLMVAVIADGYFPNATTSKCNVRIKKPRKIQRFKALLDEAGIGYKEKAKDYPTAKGFHVFTFTAPIRVKEFDERFWYCTPEQIDVIYDEVLHWDGSLCKGNRLGVFTSTSKASIDFIQAVFNSKGHIARVTPVYNAEKYANGVCYTLVIRQAGPGLLAFKSAGSDGSPNRVANRVQSTDGFKYCFTVPSTFLLFRRNGCVFASGNTGKTNSIAWAADYLLSKGIINRVLIICPMSIMKVAWQADLFRTVMHRTVGIAYGSADHRRKVIESDAEFVIINYDGVETVLSELIAGEFDMVVLDEANAIKNTGTKRFRAINQLVKPDTRLVMMTGTPAAQSPMDAYGLARMMAPDKVERTQYAFKDRVLYKVSQYTWRPKADANAYIHQLLQPAVRFTKEECLDLPEQLYETREVPLTKQQRKYYEELRREMILELAGETVTTVNAAVNMNKILQVSSGNTYTDDGNVIEFDCSHRLTELCEVIDESSHSVLVFCTFRHSIDMLYEKLTAKGYIADVIHGGISMNERSVIIDRFQQSGLKQVLIIQPQSAAHGITLHAANTVVWWSPTTSYETYAQANARVHRAGQKNPCTVIHLQGSTVERKLYAALQDKSDRQTDLLGLYKNLLED